MTVGSLFTGIGGFDLGFEAAGCRIAWQCEIDPAARRVLRARWPDVPIHADVCAIGAGTVAPVDVLVGGFPCQDVSIAGRRAGLAGARTGLFYEFIRIAGELRPAWVVLENVTGLLTNGRGRDFHAVVSTLADVGLHDRAYRVLDSQHFGVPQRRKRVFVVGSARGAFGRAGAVLLESAGGGRDSAARDESRARVAGASRGRARGVGVVGGGSWPTVSENLIPPITGRRADQTAVFLVAAPVLSKWAKRAGGPAGDECYHLAPADAAGVRRFTPLECERLQGFPDGWSCLCDARGVTARCVCPDGARYKQLGNAVTVPVAAWIAARLVGVATGAIAPIGGRAEVGA